jgi:DnaK suppressor protein
VGDLTPDQRSALRAALEALRTELEEVLSGSRDGARPVDVDLPIGRVSRVDAMQQQSMLAANRRAAEARLRQVASALARWDAGEYGECAVCGEDIGFRRLEARPEAPLCLSCQSRREASRSD